MQTAKGFVVLAIPKSGLFLEDGVLTSGDGNRVATETDAMFVKIYPDREQAVERMKELIEIFSQQTHPPYPMQMFVVEAECSVLEK